MTAEERDHLLAHARYALDLLHCRVQENPYGELEGIDTLHIGLDAMAAPLAQLIGLPDSGDPPALEDVLAYLQARGKIEAGTLDILRSVVEGIKSATYKGLNESSIRGLNDQLGGLYVALERLLNDLEEYGDDDCVA
jgi:hypothetical protein